MKFVVALFFLGCVCLASSSFRDVSDIHQHASVRSRQFVFTVVENSSTGKKWTRYVVSRGKLRIYEKPFPGSAFVEHVFTDHKFKQNDFFKALSLIGLERLEKSYVNSCVKPDIAFDYSIVYKDRSREVGIELRNYYLSEINELVRLINAFVPSTCQILYMPETVKLDCR